MKLPPQDILEGVNTNKTAETSNFDGPIFTKIPNFDGPILTGQRPLDPRAFHSIFISISIIASGN